MEDMSHLGLLPSRDSQEFSDTVLPFHWYITRSAAYHHHIVVHMHVAATFLHSMNSSHSEVPPRTLGSLLA